MTVVNFSEAAELMLSDMQKLMTLDPRSMTAMVSEAIIDTKPKPPEHEGIGNLDYADQVVDFQVMRPITLLPISQDQKAKLNLANGRGPSGELEEPYLVLLSERVAEQSIIITFELLDSEVKETTYIVMESTSIGRNAKGGSIYQLIPYRDADEDLEAEVDAHVATITGEPVSIAQPEPIKGNEFTWGAP